MVDHHFMIALSLAARHRRPHGGGPILVDTAALTRIAFKLCLQSVLSNFVKVKFEAIFKTGTD